MGFSDTIKGSVKEQSAEIIAKVIEMRFENQGFDDATARTLEILERLDKAFGNMESSARSLNNIEQSAYGLSQVPFTNLANNVQAIAANFSSMGIVGTTVLQNLTNRVVNLAASFVGKAKDMASSILGIQSVAAGFQEYEDKMGSIQTILTNTADKGTKLSDVTDVLDELNEYADMTIYNFKEMTRNIGTFTAAGVSLEDSAIAIKGISNLAAGVGSTPQQAANAMYQLSQALAAGTVNLQDWNSVVNAGMGGQYFQNALKQTAKELAEAKGLTVKTFEGTFRESLSGQGGSGWLTSEVLLETLKKFADDPALLEAATKVKTFTGLIDTMKESVGSGWTQTWEYLIGNLDEASAFFTSISQGFDRIVGAAAKSRNEMMKFWHDNGGRDQLIKALALGFQNLTISLAPVGKAFREAFPPIGPKRLVGMTEELLNFTAGLKFTQPQLEKLYKISRFVFDGLALMKDMLFGLGVTASIVIKKLLVDGFQFLENTFVKTSSAFETFVRWAEHFTGIDFHIPTMQDFVNLGNWICDMLDRMKDKFISAKAGTGEFFSTLADGKFKEFFDDLAKNVNDFLWTITLEDIRQGFVDTKKSVQEFFAQFGIHAPTLWDFWQVLDTVATGVWNLGESFQNARGKIAGFFKGMAVPEDVKAHQSELWLNGQLADETVEAAGEIEGGTSRIQKAFDVLIKVLDYVIDAGVHVVSRLSDIFAPVWDMFVKGISEIIHSTSDLSLLDVLKVITVFMNHNMYNSLNDTLDAVSSLSTAISSIGRGISRTIGKGNKFFDEMRVTLGAFQAEINSKALINIAIAVAILAGSVIALSSMDTSAGLEALFAVSILIGEIMGSMKLLSSMSKATGELSINLMPIITMSIAISILANAMRKLAELDVDSMKRGGIGITLLLAELTGISILLGKFGKKFGSGASSLILMAIAVKILAGTIAELGAMDVDNMKNGLYAVAGLLLVLTAYAFATQKAEMGAAAVGITAFLLAFGIKMLGQVVEALGNLETNVLKKGMASLGLLALGLVAFVYSLWKAPVGNLAAFGAAILSIAGALMVIATVAFLFSRFSWTSLGKAGAAIGGILLMFSVTSRLVDPANIIALSSAITTFSLAIVALGFGLVLISSIGVTGLIVSLAALAGAITIFGLAGYILKPMIPTLLALSGTLMTFAGAVALLGAGTILLSIGLASLAPGLMGAALGIGASLTIFLVALLEGIAEILDALSVFGKALVRSLIVIGLALIELIIALGPDLIEAILVLCIDLLNMLADYSYPLVVAICNFVDKFLDALIDELLPYFGDWLWKLVVVIADLLLLAIQGLLASIPGIGGACNNAIQDLRDNMNEYWDNVLDTRRMNRETDRKVKELEKGLTNSANSIDLAADGWNGANSYSKGFLDRLTAGNEEIADAAQEIPETVQDSMEEQGEEGTTAGVVIGDSLLDQLEAYKTGAADAGGEVGDEAVKGITGNVTSAFSDFGSNMNMSGRLAGYGFIDGLASTEGLVGYASANVGETAIDELYSSIDAHSPSKLAINAGEMLGEGFIAGMNSYERPAFLSSQRIGEASVNGLQDPLALLSETIDQTFDLDPTIRPILDLSDVDDGMYWLAREFANQPTFEATTSGWTPDNANMRYMSENSQPDSSNDDLLLELQGLREDLTYVEEAMSRLQVVMDTGELVGVMEDPLDRMLGSRAERSRRGGG